MHDHGSHAVHTAALMAMATKQTGNHHGTLQYRPDRTVRPVRTTRTGQSRYHHHEQTHTSKRHKHIKSSDPNPFISSLNPSQPLKPQTTTHKQKEQNRNKNYSKLIIQSMQSSCTPPRLHLHPNCPQL
ncbi:hypothetical protein P167DRAFT_361618 [Morchella conica CCBAS932]|uniref:Uncharacterized protein n=1 Tax=Morchella conica CCBAS932 TaxID=1392247 RepID=A0A3N4KCK4_9PEZI|nr:hypothetical protein P167DRAFT_361618 [Morchella conica CCBAS932]